MSLNVELRAATMLSKASLVAILEKMFKGAAPDELPQPPEPLPEDFKKRKEKAARVRRFVTDDIPKSKYVTDDAFFDGGVRSPPWRAFILSRSVCGPSRGKKMKRFDLLV